MTFYNRMQLIAYQVPTDRFFRENQFVPEDKRLPAGPVCDIKSELLGGLLKPMKEKLSADALSRVMRMIAVAERASESLAIDPTANTLKVFMAPEFYFRPEEKGPSSWSYSEEEKTLMLKALNQVFSEAKYDSWLFVFGTIIWHEKLAALVNKVPDLPVPQDKLLTDEANFPILWNTAIVVEGGAGRQIALNKVHYSEADDIPKVHRPEVVPQTMLNNLAHQNKPKVKDYLANSKKIGKEDSIFPVGDNLTLGLEICKDHESAVVALTQQKLKEKYPQLDAQLITSCGMRVQAKSLVIGEKQLVLRMDGTSTFTTDWGPPWPTSELQTVIGREGLNNLPILSSPYELDQKSNKKMEAWLELNVVADEIPLAGSLKLEPGTLQAYRLKGDPKKGLEHYQVLLDQACPQKLTVYQPAAISSAQGALE